MKKRIFLIGGFQKTKLLAKSLLKKGYYVSAINKQADCCTVLAEVPGLDVFHGDGSQPFVLEDANIYNADVAIALSDADADNLVICELCKKKFGVKKTVALVSDPRKTEFFYRMGIDSVVCAISTIANILEQQAFIDEMANMVPVGEGMINMAQVPIPTTAPSVGKCLKDLNLPRGVIIGCVMRGSHSVVPQGDTRILAGDVVVLISSSKQEKAAVKELTGH